MLKSDPRPFSSVHARSQLSRLKVQRESDKGERRKREREGEGREKESGGCNRHKSKALPRRSDVRKTAARRTVYEGVG